MVLAMEILHTAQVESPIGELRLTSSEIGLAFLELPHASGRGRDGWLQRYAPGARCEAGFAPNRRAAVQLVEYLEGKRTAFDLPLDGVAGDDGRLRDRFDGLAALAELGRGGDRVRHGREGELGGEHRAGGQRNQHEAHQKPPQSVLCETSPPGSGHQDCTPAAPQSTQRQQVRTSRTCPRCVLGLQRSYRFGSAGTFSGTT